MKNVSANIEEQNQRPTFRHSPEPDLYLPAMPPLWLLDHASFLVRWFGWSIGRYYRHARSSHSRLARLPVLLLLVMVGACDGQGIKASDCSATRVAAWASDIGPRYRRLITAWRQYRCDNIVASGISEKSIESIADKCKRMKSRLATFLNEVEGYLRLEKRRSACTNGAPGLTPLPEELRARLKRIRQELRGVLKPASGKTHWTPSEDFCRYC